MMDFIVGYDLHHALCCQKALVKMNRYQMPQPTFRADKTHPEPYQIAFI